MTAVAHRSVLQLAAALAGGTATASDVVERTLDGLGFLAAS